MSNSVDNVLVSSIVETVSCFIMSVIGCCNPISLYTTLLTHSIINPISCKNLLSFTSISFSCRVCIKFIIACSVNSSANASCSRSFTASSSGTFTFLFFHGPCITFSWFSCFGVFISLVLIEHFLSINHSHI